MKLKAFTPFHSNLGQNFDKPDTPIVGWDSTAATGEHWIAMPTAGQTGTTGFQYIAPNWPTLLNSDDHILLCVEMQDRMLPGPIVKKRVEELADEVERTTHRKVGKKQRAELKEQAIEELLPKAFIKTTQVHVTLFRKEPLLLVWSTSSKRVDQVLTLLAKIGGPDMRIDAIQTKQAPSVALTAFVRDSGVQGEGLFQDLIPCRDVLIHNGDGAKIRTTNVSTEADSVQAPITHLGYDVSEVAIATKDEVTFTLTDNLCFKKFDIGTAMTARELSSKDDGALEAIAWLSATEAQRALGYVLEMMGGAVPAGDEGGL